ncbi:MAG: hypothetical protein PHH01_02380 [Patescibacteria group bacterium]|nr:hypothetical protein [Patescibacteria group bacterium]
MGKGSLVDLEQIGSSLAQPLSEEGLAELYLFLSHNPACHQLYVLIGRSGGKVDMELAEQIRLAAKIPQDVFYARLTQMVAAVRLASGTDVPAEEAEAKPRRQYRRRSTAKRQTAGKSKRGAKKTKGEPATLDEKVQHLIAATRKRDETPKKTLKRLLAEHAGPRQFCKFANPILKKRGVRGFSPGQYHQLT